MIYIILNVFFLYQALNYNYFDIYNICKLMLFLKKREPFGKKGSRMGYNLIIVVIPKMMEPIKKHLLYLGPYCY